MELTILATIIGSVFAIGVNWGIISSKTSRYDTLEGKFEGVVKDIMAEMKDNCKVFERSIEEIEKRMIACREERHGYLKESDKKFLPVCTYARDRDQIDKRLSSIETKLDTQYEEIRHGISILLAHKGK